MMLRTRLTLVMVKSMKACVTADGDYGLITCGVVWYLLTESATLLKISTLETDRAWWAP